MIVVAAATAAASQPASQPSIQQATIKAKKKLLLAYYHNVSSQIEESIEMTR
jgi:hypothetical protein